MASKAAPLLLVLTLLAVNYGDSQAKGHHAAAPAPAVDCSSLVLNMADCLSFVSAGSSVNKPEGQCCSGLKTVLQTDASCLCEAFKSSASLGVVLNVSKAMTLPTLCKLSAPSPSNCNLSLPPSAAPGMAPTTTGGAEAPGSDIGSNPLTPTPAPTPGVSASSVISISATSIAIALVLAFFSTN